MKFAVKAGLVCLVALLATAAVSAMMIAPQPIPLRVAHADVIVAGKVTKIEDKTVSAPSFPGAKDKVEYQIAVVKVDDPILNAKGIKEVRVGFIPPPAPGGGRPGGPQGGGMPPHAPVVIQIFPPPGGGGGPPPQGGGGQPHDGGDVDPYWWWWNNYWGNY